MSQQPAQAQTRVIEQPLPEADWLRGRIALALDTARRSGASAAEGAVSASSALSVTVRKDEVESVEFQADRDLGITVYFGQRKASASTTDLKDAALREAVERACTLAKHTGEDQYAGLAEADEMADELPDLDLYHPWTPAVDEAVALARQCEAAAFAVDPRIENSEGASLDTRRGISFYGNSHGFVGERRGTSHSLSCVVIARDEAGMQRDYWYDTARLRGALESAEQIGRRAGERSIARLSPRSVETGRAPVVFAPNLARGLIGKFVAAISGGALYRKASFLLDAVGTQVFAPHIGIIQRPHLPRAMGSAAFDDDGVATRERELVAGGVLQGYVLGSYSARRLGLETTGNAGGVYNLSVEPGELDRAGLLREAGTGLLATEMMGQGVNLVTGDYSRGASGFWFEDGEIAYPVENVTVAGNLADMFRNIRAVGNDVDTRGSIRCGSLWIDGLTVAGQ